VPVSVLVLLFLLSFRIVNAGEVAVVTRLGKVTGRVLEPGPHFIIPIAEKAIKYNTKKIIYETTTPDKNPRTSLRYARGILVPLRATHDLELALSANLHPRATSRGFKIGEE